MSEPAPELALWSAEGQQTLVSTLSSLHEGLAAYVASLSAEELADFRLSLIEERDRAEAHAKAFPTIPYDPSSR